MNGGTSETELRASDTRSLEQSARKNRVKCCRFWNESDQFLWECELGTASNRYHLVRVYTV
jgi:hypothetical protein